MQKMIFTPTDKQKKLAELLVAGEHSTVDAYVIAYEPTEEDQQDRQKIASRAYMASKSKGVLYWIQKLQEQQAVEEARILVWDKRKASRRLLEMTNEAQITIDIVRELRDRLVAEGGATSHQLNQMLKVSEICNRTSSTILEIVKEMNKMYGLSNPSVSLGNAVQIIIGGVEELPDDDIDY